MESGHAEIANELKQVSAARQEAERKRKQAEQQVQEVTFHVTELEKGKGDMGEKATKLLVCNIMLYHHWSFMILYHLLSYYTFLLYR